MHVLFIKKLLYRRILDYVANACDFQLRWKVRLGKLPKFVWELFLIEKILNKICVFSVGTMWMSCLWNYECSHVPSRKIIPYSCTLLWVNITSCNWLPKQKIKAFMWLSSQSSSYISILLSILISNNYRMNAYLLVGEL